MTTAQVVETLVTVNNTQPNEHTQPTYQVTPGFKPFTVLRSLGRQSEQLKMTTVEVVNQPARKIFSRGLLRLG